jgi:site-specific DNA-methyltransferase (adenine-specific)
MSKSKSIPMLIDNHLGNPNKCNQKGKASKKCAAGTNNQNRDSMLEYVPISPEAKMWDGYGSARVKSAFTPIIIAQKPLSEINIAANVLKWGTGAINIADCLIEGHSTDPSFKGRFPTDIILECICSRISIEDVKIGKKIKKVIRHVNPNCPCYQMDQQSGITSQGHWSKNKTSGYGAFGGGNSQYLGTGKKDTVYGGASRFFKIIYTNKASKRDKEEGLGYIPGSKVRSNTHPTVKPTDLMQELVCLLAPKGSKIIDPYFGAGSTGKGAIRAGRGCSGELEYNFIGIEICKEYFDIAVKRCQYEYEQSISDHDSVA